MIATIDAATVFTPLPWQVAPWRDKSPVLLLAGAAGGGKSRLAVEKIHALLLKYPGATALVGRKDKTSANRSIVPFLRYTVQGLTDWGTYKKGDSLFEYHNGSHAWVVGVKDEGQREALKSIGKDGAVDFALFEEANALTEDDHNLLLSRMRGDKAGWRQIIYASNPDSPDHWINQRLILGGQASVHTSRPEDNKYNPEDYIETLKSLTGVYYDRLYLGLWVQAEGAIYDEYDSSIHLLDRDAIKVDPHGRFIVSVDFGYTNPFTATLWYIDNDNRMYLYKQIYRTKRIVEDHCPAIREMIAGVNVEACITDHDAEDRATLEKHLGITTIPAYKAVMVGIQNVKQRLKAETIFFMRGAVDNPDEARTKDRLTLNTVDEIPGYSWSDKKQDTPIKDNDHGLDDMRYAAAYIDKLGIKTARVPERATITNYTRGEVEEREKIGF